MKDELEENEKDVQQRTQELKELGKKAEALADTAEAIENTAEQLKNVFCCADYTASVKLYGMLFGTVLIGVRKSSDMCQMTYVVSFGLKTEHRVDVLTDRQRFVPQTD